MARRILLSTLAILAVLMVALGVLRVFVLSTYWMPSASMEPTIEIGDRIVVNRRDTNPAPGDIVVHRTTESELDVVKRVVAVAGQTVEIRDGLLMVDEAVVDESYLDPGVINEDFPLTTVPEETIFALGDNRSASYDSRFNGPVPLEDVVGTVIFVS